MVCQIRTEFPEFGSITESDLVLHGQTLGWQVTAHSVDGTPVGSGFHQCLESARKIAAAEFIERRFVVRTRESRLAVEWRLDERPTACGFAAGFDLENTKVRSLCEALERWALANWVDGSYSISERDPKHVSKAALTLLTVFDEFRSFQKSFIIPIDGAVYRFELYVVVGFSKRGAYIGSAVRSDEEDAFQHAVVEAHRHWIIAHQERDFSRYPYNRVKFFSLNRPVAEQILAREYKVQWPMPQIEFQRIYLGQSYFVVRTILDGWEPWELGPLDRMLY